jgi:ribosome-associated protein
MEFELVGYEYIELNKLLKMLSLVSTGGEANVVIQEGEVLVNGQVETQKRKKLRVGDKVEFEGKTITIK